MKPILKRQLPVLAFCVTIVLSLTAFGEPAFAPKAGDLWVMAGDSIKAQPVLISSSPVNDGSLPGNWKSDRCRRLDLYTNALKKLAEEEGVVFVDQYHPLLELWGQNRAKGDAAVAAQPGDKDLPKKYS